MEKSYEFDTETRAKLLDRVRLDDEDQQDLFILRLEGQAKMLALELFDPQCQPQSLKLGAELRKQQIRSLENHLRKAAALLLTLDDNLFGEMARQYSLASGQHWNPFYYRHFEEPETRLLDPLIALNHLAAAAEKIKCEFPKDRWSVVDSTARSVKYLFMEFGIPFAVSNLGAAADCLRAVMHKAGDTNADRVDHLLTKARDIPSFFDPPTTTEKNL